MSMSAVARVNPKHCATTNPPKQCSSVGPANCVSSSRRKERHGSGSESEGTGELGGGHRREHVPMRRVWRPVFAQPPSFSIGERLAEGAFSLQPRSFQGLLLFREPLRPSCFSSELGQLSGD